MYNVTCHVSLPILILISLFDFVVVVVIIMLMNIIITINSYTEISSADPSLKRSSWESQSPTVLLNICLF
jgi:hypothetical protein